MNSWPISPLGSKDLDFAVKDYGFSTLTATEQAPLPSMEAAIDSDLIDFTFSVSDQIPLIGSLFDGVEELAAIPGEIDGLEFTATAAALAQAATTGDQLFSTFSQTIGAGSPPPPPPPTGGGTPTGKRTINFPTTPSGTSSSLPFPMKNTGSKTLTIKGFTLAGINGPNLFSLPPVPKPYQIPAGQTLSDTIFCDATNATPGAYSSTLTIDTDRPDPQPTVTLTVTVTAGPGPGGGGGGDDGGCIMEIDAKGRLVCGAPAQ